MEYPPTPGYEEHTASGYDPYGPAPTVVTMITEEVYPYATTTESYDYAKEVTTMTTQVPYEYPTGPPYYEGSDGDAALGEEGPTDCNCQPGEPGFAGFAGPKVRHRLLSALSNNVHINGSVWLSR